MSDPKAVLFDVDGTLFDRDRAQEEALRLIARQFRSLFAGIGEERLLDAFLESDRVAVAEINDGTALEGVRLRRSRRFLGMLGLSEEHAGEITAFYVRSYPGIEAPIDGARSVVERVAGAYPVGVLSNGLPDVQYRKLETLELRELFQCVVLSGELEIWKPDPRIFWEAAARLDREPGECLYVGDSYAHDVVGAAGAGMRVCWFNRAASAPAQAEPEPDFEIRKLDEVVAVLDIEQEE